MLKPANSTAILIFANSSQKEAEQKSILGAEKLFSYFNKQILEKVQKTELPYFIYSEKEQDEQHLAHVLPMQLQMYFPKGLPKLSLSETIHLH